MLCNLGLRDFDNALNAVDKKYIKHKKGYIIFGALGVGKTYFINSDKNKSTLDN